MPAPKLESLKTDNHSEIARDLAYRLIDVVRADAKAGGAKIADKLERLCRAVWPSKKNNEMPMEPQALEQLFNAVLSDLSAKEKTQLLENYARIGHLHEMAGLIARENFLKDPLQQPNGPKGGAEEFVAAERNKNEALETIIDKLNTPIFEVVMTAHPTNTNSLESMREQRKLAKAIESKDEAEITSAMRSFVSTPLTAREPDLKDGFQNTNFCVRDETQMMLDYLGNIYEDLPRVYAPYDKALGEVKSSTTYNPAALNLRMQFGSWGSAGDKDGNVNIMADNTLEAMVMHTSAIVTRYLAELGELKKAGINYPELDKWQGTLEKANVPLQELMASAKGLVEWSKEARQANPPITAQERKRLDREFDRISKALADIRLPLKQEEFTQDLAAAHTREIDPVKETRILHLLRRARTFGFNFSKIEYRETAEEYARVAGVLLADKHYGDRTPHKKLEALSELMGESTPFKNPLTGGLRGRLITEGAGKNYIKQDPKEKLFNVDAAIPIAYQTMKRMELARDHPDMIKDNVLAECGKLSEEQTSKRVEAQGAVNMLEALLLQKIVARKEKDGTHAEIIDPSDKQAHLGIIPLFEEPSTMQKVGQILEKVYNEPVYQRHLDILAIDGTRTQEVQIAHSDNARRAGLLAARANIHEAHRSVRQINKEKKIRTRFFEGGSISDAYRNGVRAISSTVNAFDLHDFAKFTFQGGDLLNYFNMPCSVERLFTRNFAHAAARFIRDEDSKELRPMTDDEWKKHHEAEMGSHANAVKPKDLRTTDRIADAVAIEALKKTLEEYTKNDFKKETMGVILDALDYHDETRAGGAGSRAGSRSSSFGKTHSTSVGTINPVDVVDGVRTIGFSEAWQHGGIVPSWIGGEQLEDKLRDQILSARKMISKNSRTGRTTKGERAFFERFAYLTPVPESATNLPSAKAEKVPLKPEDIHYFYETSPTFRDAEDRAAFALAMTDPEAFTRIADVLDKKKDATYKSNESDPMEAPKSYVDSGKKYLEKLKTGYRAVGDFALAAIMDSKDYKNKFGQERARLNDTRSGMIGVLKECKNEIYRKTSFRNFLVHLKSDALQRDIANANSAEPKTETERELSDFVRRLIHNAGDTVMHGRLPRADDRAYSLAHFEKTQRGIPALE